MRLSDSQKNAIVKVIEQASKKIGSKAELYLFGSRTKDYLKGGDIDLLLLSKTESDKSYFSELKFQLISKIKEKIGDQRVDLKIAAKADLKTDPFLQTISDSLQPLENSKISRKKTSNSSWRLCPGTEYWRNEHVQNSYTKADGTFVRAHQVSGCCCKRPSGKDQIYTDEMKEIAKKHFSNLKVRPEELPKRGDWYPNNPNAFDDYIAGWTKYWNDIFKPKELLDPNLVKALSGSESMFNPMPKDQKISKNNFARGLLQITDETRNWLGNENLNEIKDHFVHVDGDEIYDPNFSICPAIRWLFRKKELASASLGRPATWEEAVANYKGVLKASEAIKTRELKQFKKIYKLLNRNL